MTDARLVHVIPRTGIWWSQQILLLCNLATFISARNGTVQVSYQNIGMYRVR